MVHTITRNFFCHNLPARVIADHEVSPRIRKMTDKIPMKRCGTLGEFVSRKK